jgi:hypothetical protein
MKQALRDDDALVHRRHFLRTLGLAGAATAGLTALEPSSALAFELGELETKLRELGSAAAKFDIAIGSGALEKNTAANNTALGFGALEANTEGGSNTAVGSKALLANTTGKENVAIGSGALKSNTTGQENVAIGGALKENTVGKQNIAVGCLALNANIEGNANVAIGGTALSKNTTGSSNVAVGNVALKENTTGSENTALGATSLQKNTTGIKNTAVGWEAMVINEDGNQNVAIGYAALAEQLHGEHNVAVGNSALAGGKKENNGTASKNVAIGYIAGLHCNNGEGNVFLGHAAGEKEEGSNTLYIANTNTTAPLIKGNFSTKLVTINGRLEPGEAAAKPSKGVEKEVIANEISATRKRSASLVGDGTTKKWKFEHKLNTRLVSILVQKAATEEPSEFIIPEKLTIVGINTVEVTLAAAPGAGEELFITVFG